MDDPPSDLRADPSEGPMPPDFGALTSPKELVRGERTRDDFFDAVLGLDSPATVEEVAEMADHGRDAAREYLDWFERMGIVKQVTTSPATYERNQEYLMWRRTQRLRDRYAAENLLEFLEAETERDREFADAFDADRPDAVSISAIAADTERSVESIWEDVSAWRTTRRRIELLERALAAESGNGPGQRTSV